MRIVVLAISGLVFAFGLLLRSPTMLLGGAGGAGAGLLMHGLD